MTSVSPAKTSYRFSLRMALAMTLLSASVTAEAVESSDDATRSGEQFFESRVRPLLVEHCYQCHGLKKHKGNLRLDSQDGMLDGGDSGPALVPGDVEHSHLVQAIRYGDEFVQMPPSKKLNDDQIAMIVRWVEMGAPWPSEARSTAKRPARSAFEITDADRAWWSFQPIQRPKPPNSHATQSTSPIDAFIDAKLRDKQLTPVARATKRELIRRAAFDLLGLPPTPEEVETFEKDESPDAFAKLVDRYLERPEYGQRWARHWLDVVRYAQTNGYERDDEKPYAWRYRDYVIRAFNDDKPFDQFIIEQLAGDELDEVTDDSLIATGFYRLGVWDDEPDDARMAEFEELDDIVVTVGAAFMGVTVGCARCHDHMFDPVPQADYYRLLSFFRNIRPFDKPKFTEGSANFRPLPSEEVTAREFFARQREDAERLKQSIEETEGEEAKKSLRSELRKVENREAPFEWVLAVRERKGTPLPTHVLVRGSAASPSDEVEPTFLSVLGAEKPELPSSTDGARSSGRRLALARWLSDARNPLPARVMANRVWQHHFGHGIVKTTTDFGRAGVAPSHPELLDWLAAEFIDSDFSVKHLHRVIMNSEVYQRSSSTVGNSSAETDASDEWYWRQNLRRLEAEAIRDTMLAVSGQLDTSLEGRGFFPRLEAEVLAGQSKPGYGWEISPDEESRRRSVYMFVKRTMIPPALDLFDYNNTAQPIGERSTTTVAPQPLMLLHDRFVAEQAEALAKRLVAEAGDNKVRQIEDAYRLAFGRGPTAQELSIARDYIDRQRRAFAALPPRLIFRPHVPTTLHNDFLEQLHGADILDGPRSGWAYGRGLWEKGYQVTKVVDFERGPYALWEGANFKDATIRARLILDNTSDVASLVLRATPRGDAFRGYELLLDFRNGTASVRRHEGKVRSLGEFKTSLPSGEPIDVKVVISGPRIRVWIGEGKPILNVVDSDPLDEAGQVGIRAWGAPLKVTQLTVSADNERFDVVKVSTRSDDETPSQASTRRALEAFCLLLFNLNEMIYVD